MNELDSIVDFLKIPPKKLIEFGAAHPTSCRLDTFIKNGADVTLVEASPRLHYCLVNGYNDGDFMDSWPNVPAGPYQHKGYKEYPNCKIINAAIAPNYGFVKLYERNASTFVGGINSPAKINDGYIQKDGDFYTVPTITIQDLDDGKIDVLLADVEGSEFFCLKGLKSEPRLIILETHGQRYVNPYIEEIDLWRKSRGYKIIHQTESDTVFFKTT